MSSPSSTECQGESLNPTEAQAFIRARRTAAVKAGQVDYVLGLYNLIAPDMPSWVAPMLAKGQLAIGELFESTPRAVTESEEDGSIAVGISSGFIDYIYAFARAVATQFTVHGIKRIVQPSIPRSQAIAELKRLFKLFEAGEHVFHGEYTIDPEQVQIADDLAKFAELLVFAHELGHVSEIHDQLPIEELDADRFAASLILSLGARTQYRAPLAGAFLGFRVYAILERFGFKFDHSHPPTTERLNCFLDVAKAHFGGRAAMMAKLSITLGLDELVESLENEAQGKGSETTQSSLRVGVRLRAMLEEVTCGRLPVASLPSELSSALREVPADVMTNVLEDYAQDVTSGEIVNGSFAIAVLCGVVSETAEPVRTVLQDCMSKVKIP